MKSLLLLLILSNIFLINAVPFFPFGTANGDAALQRGNDNNSGQQTLLSALTFYGTSYTKFYVNTNGFISFGTSAITTPFDTSSFPLSTSNIPMMALYYADADTTPTASGQVYGRMVSGADSNYDPFLSSNFGVSFTSNYKIILTWDHVGYNNGHTDLTVTAQMAVFVGSGMTFTCFNYATNGLGWICGDNNKCTGGFPNPANSNKGIAQVGFNKGDGSNSFSIPGSRTANVDNIGNKKGNIEVTGQYCYRVDGTTIANCNPIASCKSGPMTVYYSDPVNFSDVNSGSSTRCGFTPSLTYTSFTCSQVGQTVTNTLTIGGASCSTTFKPYSNIQFTYCPPSQTVSADSCAGAYVSWNAPTYSSDCPATLSGTHTSGSFFTVGKTTVTFTATDSTPAQNKDTCTFSVTVLGSNTAPAILGAHSDVTETVSTPQCSVRVDWSPPVVQQVCSAYTVTSNYQPNIDFFPVPSKTLITYDLADSYSHTDSTSFYAIVEDGYAPVIVCPSAFSREADTGLCNTQIVIPYPNVVDCDLSTVTSTLQNTTYSVNTYTGTYTATDGSGNSNACTYSFQVTDKQKPSIKCVPSQITAVEGPNCVAGSPCLTDASYTLPTASDNCDTITPQWVSGIKVGTPQGFGSYTVNYIATDLSSNSDSCGFKVEVIGVQVNTPGSVVYQDQTITFTFNHYLPSDTQAVFRIINVSTGRAIKAVTINLASGSVNHIFSITSSPGMYSASLTAVTSKIASVADPVFKVCVSPSNCP